MAVSKNKSRAVLGDNPLAQGIFSKTATESSLSGLPTNCKNNNQEYTLKNKESRFLAKVKKRR